MNRRVFLFSLAGAMRGAWPCEERLKRHERIES